MTDTEYQKKRNETLKRIPKEYRDGTAAMAYQLGHSCGYGETLMYLEDLVTTIFKK
jgi:hypothetical protein